MSDRLSLDEILTMVSEIARDPGAGADRFRALKMLATTESQQAVLTEPLSQPEIIQRASRILRGIGIHASQLSFQQAFPKTKATPFQPPRLEYGDLSDEEREAASHVRTLKGLYKKFPEIKRPGFPPGYPVGKSHIQQQAWCQNAALKAMVDRKQAELMKNSKEKALHGGDTGTPGAAGDVQEPSLQPQEAAS